MVFAVVKVLDAILKAHSKLANLELPADQTVGIETARIPATNKADLHDVTHNQQSPAQPMIQLANAKLLLLPLLQVLPRPTHADSSAE